MPSATQAAAPDTEELAHFRERWRQEIRGRAHPPPPPPPPASAAPPAAVSRHQRAALATYGLAVAREQSGDHPEATRLYRNAFRLDPDVDKAHHRAAAAQRGPPHAAPPAPPGPAAPAARPGPAVPLAALLAAWPRALPFAPGDGAHGVPIARLPDELLVAILCRLARGADVAAIERFAAVSRRARVLTLDAAIWRKLVQLTMVPPQLADTHVPLAELAERYRSDYRRVYVEHPRLRLDGVYISICHYVRNGLGENPWVTVSHLITYRRFLRFLPNGEVLSYRANEDQDIVDVVHALQPGLRRKDLCVGKWRLRGTTVLVTNLIYRVPHGLLSGGDNYSFQMNLTLKSRPSLGRWNKLDLLDYESVNLATGETSPLPLRHERPFWFSKVRSY